jgi:hypothetical protein
VLKKFLSSSPLCGNKFGKKVEGGRSQMIDSSVVCFHTEEKGSLAKKM